MANFTERRGQPRRAADRAADCLQQTLNSCFERIANGVVLLNYDGKVIYATTQAEQFAKKSDALFSLSPALAPRQPKQSARFSAFLNDKNMGTDTLNLLLEDESGDNKLLLSCFRITQTAVADTQTACYLVTLRDPHHYSSYHWQLFSRQFRLTQAETRLCRALGDGLTLNDYCRQWRITVSTARSQLSSIFDKTSTRRQSDLLRIIFLFTRG